jgi:serine/threonine protein kinase
MERLGKGSFGEVFKVMNKQTCQIYAMKILKKKAVMSGNLLRYAVTERNVLSYIRHPYMVSLHYAFQTRTYLVMVMQFAPHGNLQHLLDYKGKLPADLAQLYTAEILLGLIHLHARRIVFRDLKPDNVVLDGEYHACLTDFGLSKEGVSALHGTKSFCGSVAFLAPEILQRKGHRHTVDIYGLGVLLFDMLTGLPPFYHQDREKLYHNIKHARLVVPSDIPEDTADFIKATMNKEQSLRLGAHDSNDVKGHGYFDNVDFEALMRREVEVPPVSFAPINQEDKPIRENPFLNKISPPVRPVDVEGWSFSAHRQ